MYLHGDCVFDKHRSQLSIELKKDLSLPGLVQVTQCQGLDVEDLPSLQLHLQYNSGTMDEKAKGRGGHGVKGEVMEIGLGYETEIHTWTLCSQVQLKQ